MSTDANDVNGRWVKTYLGLFDHPALSREPFCERAAFIWLVAHAAWRQHRIRGHDGQLHTLERGQILIGRAHLASTWNWTEKKVRVFIERLERENMLKKGQSKGRFANIATICNYEKFQSVAAAEGQLNGQIGAGSGPVKGHTVEDNRNNRRERTRAKSPVEGRTDATALPADWQLPAEWRAWALNRIEISAGMIDSEALRFRNYWHGIRGAKGCKADWFATWQNWITRNRELRQTPAASSDQLHRGFPYGTWQIACQRYDQGHGWERDLPGGPPDSDTFEGPDDLRSKLPAAAAVHEPRATREFRLIDGGAAA